MVRGLRSHSGVIRNLPREDLHCLHMNHVGERGSGFEIIDIGPTLLISEAEAYTQLVTSIFTLSSWCFYSQDLQFGL